MQVIRKPKHVAKTIMTSELGNDISFRSFPEVLQAATARGYMFCAIIMHMSFPLLTSFLEEARDLTFYCRKDLGAKGIDANEIITELLSNFGYVYRMADIFANEVLGQDEVASANTLQKTHCSAVFERTEHVIANANTTAKGSAIK